MEHYRELIELRKKNSIKTNEGLKEQNRGYPGTQVMILFDKTLSEHDKLWLVYENEVLINRKPVMFPHQIMQSIKNYVFLIEKDSAINEIITALYNIKEYNPLTYFLPVLNLPTNTQNQVKKAMHTLQAIENSIQIFAVGQYNGKHFTICSYNKIDKNIAKVFIENGCSILFTKMKRSITLYFDPMEFEETDLDIISTKISSDLNIHTAIDYDYNNYSISFMGDFDSIDIFNIVNEDERFLIHRTIEQQENIQETEQNIETTEIPKNVEQRKQKFVGKLRR